MQRKKYYEVDEGQKKAHQLPMANPDGINRFSTPYAGREREIAEAIAERLKTGEPLAQILRENNQPSYNTLKHWRASDAEIDAIISGAREEGFDAIAAECLAIADDSSRDTIETERGEIPDSEWIARSRLRVETRLKLLAKWDPKRYGDKMDVTSGGEQLQSVPVVTFALPPVFVQRRGEAHARN